MAVFSKYINIKKKKNETLIYELVDILSNISTFYIFFFLNGSVQKYFCLLPTTFRHLFGIFYF